MRALVKMMAVVAVSAAMRIDAHTPKETNDVVQAMLEIVATSSDDSFDSFSRPWRVVRWSDKEKFFGIGVGGWTRDEKEAAFLSYLGQLGSRDFGEHTTPFYTGDGDARMAVWVCENVSYTNAVPSLMGLITNRTCSADLRCTAIRAYVKLCTVDDESTCFVETVTTNHLAYTLRERGLLRGHYADKIMPLASSSGERRMIYDRAVKMFYRHRMEDVGGASMLDILFSTAFDGYSFSSNRLEVARFVLAQTNCNHLVRRNFTVITNQLLSTGQPLRQLNLEGAEQ